MYTYNEMTIDHYDQAIKLWERTPGMGLSEEVDSRKAISAYLQRNPGLSYVCLDENKNLIGTVLCGNDGRRGFMYHVAVDPAHRGRSIAKTLIRFSLEQLRHAGIMKCHLMVLDDNEIGNRFWASQGWQRRDHILLYSSSTL
ncbi:MULTISPECIES: GNAT family N-acetyltransferase [unclassified Paenibacillus]|uniref:GNAT family N-acetyltransferase n=1 Tax=Paenibacillus TaxID=44249 RepID=UPI000888FFD9|nr:MULTISPECIES: GNAT family N-acetyltransferase [unclassified Paenibacillus]SDK03182.1 Ribosomal protein S18 acetylase RimI [Paenibacillus sp. OK060]SEK27506.1 Ribosomal protein S18 acetylase RimI [Paenibacillus sp. OK003]